MAYASQQIRTLRKSGDLQGAYRLAVEAYRSEPGNKYIASELTWVLYDCLKRYKANDNQYFKKGKTYAKSLRIIAGYKFNPLENDMFYKCLIKSVGSVSWDLANSEKTEDLRRVFEATVDLSAIDVRFRNDVLMKAFLKGFTKEPLYLVDAIRWYGFSSFSRDDYLDEEYQGKKMPGLAEKMANSYLDCMVKKNPKGNSIFPMTAQEDAVSTILPLISRQECTHWNWLEYKLGKLLIAMGRNAEARDILAPFVLRKSKEAYAWATYGETFRPEHPELYAACIFRALQLSKDPKYALSYHEAAIGLFAQMGDYAAAKLEAETVSKCRYENGWQQSPIVQRAQQESWYSSSRPSEGNAPKYRALGADAEATLESYVPKVDFFLEWTAPEKGLAGIDTFPSPIYTLDRAERLCLHDANLAKNYEPGRVYTASLDKNGLRMYGNAIPSDNKRMESVFVRSFEGVFEAVKSYGFVHTRSDDVWIPERLVKEHALTSLTRVKGQTIASFRKNKGAKDDEWTQVPKILEVTPPSPEEICKEIEGTVRIARGGFGFVSDDSFIPPKLIEECDLRDGDTVRGMAVKSWNKKKRQWSWAVNRIIDRIDVEFATAPRLSEPDGLGTPHEHAERICESRGVESSETHYREPQNLNV